MKKAYILSTCNTCKRILNEISWSEEYIDLKKEMISEDLLDRLADEYGGYEALFNKRARKYADYKEESNSYNEAQWKALIMQDYTFIKRPIFIFDDKSFVGNSKEVVTNLKSYLHG